jgi:hypothetical protein
MKKIRSVCSLFLITLGFTLISFIPLIGSWASAGGIISKAVTLGRDETSGVGPSSILAVERGNAASIFQYNLERQRPKARSTFTHSPFPSPARVFEGPQTAQQERICINFDTLMNGDAIPGGTLITTQYQSLGVIFSSDDPDAPGLTTSFNPYAVSLPNTVYAGSDLGKTMTATFVDPMSGAPAVTNFVSITTDNDLFGQTEKLIGLDINGNVVAMADVNFANPSQVVSISTTTPMIHQVQLVTSDFFDDLCFGPLLQAPCVTPPPGLVAWWPLDDAVGQSTVQDLVGGNNGTTKDSTGTPLNISLGAGPQVVSQLPAPNILGGQLNPVVVDPSAPPPPPTPRGALFFNNSFAEVPHNPNLNIGPNGFTITLWAHTAGGIAPLQPLLDKFDLPANDGYSLYLDNWNSTTNTYTLRFKLNGTIVTGPTVGLSSPLSPSDWHFITVTVSPPGIVQLTVCKLGSPWGSCSTTTSTVPNFQTSNIFPLWLAGERAIPLPIAPFARELALDEVEIFGRPLMPSELQSIYDGESKGQRKCPPTPCVPRPPDMVAWYPLDEQNSATTVTDIAPPPASTVSDTGTPMPGPVGSGGPNPVPGKVGAGALYFFGPFVEVPPSADLTFTGDFSIDAWIRVVECGMSGGGVLAPIVDKWDPTTQTGFSFFVDQPSPSTGFLKLQLNNMLFTSTGSLPTGANPLANTGPWVHVAVTVNRTPGVGTFYINGAPAGTFTVPAGSITNALTMLIGEIRVPGGRCELAIDELELFKRVLTPKEVQDLFNADSAGKCRPQPGQTGQICVTKFEDLDGDGVQDPNEPLLPNWVFNVTDPSNNPVGTITTTPPGTPPACLTVAAPGTYTVTEQVQSGWMPTTPNPQTVTVQPGQTVNVTFGNKRQAGQICVVKFEDLDGDGVQDPGEPLLPNWVFNVTDPSNNPVGTITTTPPGTPPACLTVPAPGTYTVTEQVQSGWMPTTPNPQTVTVTPGQTANVTFGNKKTGMAEVCVFKFEDKNGNGIHEPNPPNNEPLLAGWTFNVSPGPPNQVTTTPQGGICFGVPAPGTYTISEMIPPPPPTWTPTTPTSQTVTVQPSQLVNLFFGNKKEECDLLIRKSISPNPAQSGQPVTITLTVMNVGTGACQPGAFPGTVVSDPRPPGLTFNLPVNITQSGGSATWQCGLGVPTGDLSCATQNPLPPGYSATFTFTATVTGAAGSNIQNCATVTNQNDINTQNNQSCVTLQVTGCVTPPANMTAWWPFDEPSGTTANDLAGVPNNGTLVNGPTHIAGMVGGALRFDGVNDHVTVADHAELNFGTGDLSIDAWIRTTGTTDILPIVDKRATVGNLPRGYTLFLFNGRLAFQLADAVGTGFTNYISNASVNDGNWHHVAVTVQRTGGSPSLILYVDGMPAPGGTFTNPRTGNLTNTAQLWIGRRIPVPGAQAARYFIGDIDEVELFNRALSQQEIQAIFQAGSAGKCKGCIEGMKWNDANGNGVINPGEAGLSGWTIQLTGPVNQTTTTGTGGTYRFCGLPPGTYTVAEVLQPLWVQTFPPTPGTHTVTLAANQVVTGRNFGNRRVIVFPDFVVRNLTAIPPGIPGGNVALGSQVLVRFDIVNQGTGEAGPARHEIRLFIPEGAGHGQIDRLLATVMTGPLAAGGSQSFTQPVTIPRDVPTGPALIRVIADAPNGISESEEGNNVAEFRIVLIRPGP